MDDKYTKLGDELARQVGAIYDSECLGHALRQAHADGKAEAIEEVRAILRPVDVALMALCTAGKPTPTAGDA